MAEHLPVTKEVVEMDCLYEECEHDLDSGECPSTTMLVCDTCREKWEDGDLDLVVCWPCEHAPVSADSGTGGDRG